MLDVRMKFSMGWGKSLKDGAGLMTFQLLNWLSMTVRIKRPESFSGMVSADKGRVMYDMTTTPTNRTVFLNGVVKFRCKVWNK